MATSENLNARPLPSGTRVVVIKDAPRPGTIREVRPEPHLKMYVVTCDDGATVYASPHDLAREDDTSRAPLGPRPEY